MRKTQSVKSYFESERELKEKVNKMAEKKNAINQHKTNKEEGDCESNEKNIL